MTIIDTFAHLKANLATKGIVIDEFDLLIGATALSMNYSVVTNNDPNPRNGYITIGNEQHDITQGGVLCNTTFTPSNKSFPAGGGLGTASISTANLCPWTVSSNVSWITIQSPRLTIWIC